MNKMLIKRLLFELLEELIHLECSIQDRVARGSLAEYLKILENSLAEIRDELWSYHDLFLALYQESPLEEKFAETCLSELFPMVRAKIELVSKSFYRITTSSARSEMEQFLSSLYLNKLLPDSPGIVVLSAEGENDREPVISSESLLVEYLPVTSFENPLRWVGLTRTFSRYFCEKTIQLCSFMERLNIAEPKEEIITPLLNLRIMGPSYYSYYVLNAFKRSDAKALWAVEPILFQELNRFGLINKDLVILHQSIERGRQYCSIEEPRALTRVLGKEDLRDELHLVIERIIPERLAFTEKSFIRTQLLEERIDNGILISAVPMMSSPAQLREELNTMDSEQSIYPLMRQLKELPATPREIINGGWLYKLDRSPDWLQTILDMSRNESLTQGWESLKRTVVDLDTLILKSIEISEVHRVLSAEDAEYMVPA